MKYTPHHIAISVRNLKKSLAFYMALGYKQVHRYDEDDKTNVHLKLGNSFIEMFAYKQNQTKPPVDYEYANNLSEIGVKHIALGTDDVDAALADLKEKGLADETTKINAWLDVSFFFIKDPDGVWVEFIRDDRY
ncbi:MAG TPA: VOC family protein [Candidatus Limnocylindria bacterium]|nr:VOC family protein [Candidatus Limnocylindria bacterium]